MSLYKEWDDNLKNIKTESDYQSFWQQYMTKETECYRKILESKNPVIAGKLCDLADKNDMTTMQYVGFLDGANTSFTAPLTLDELSEDTELNVEFDFEKLLWNMHEAKAEWLYGMDEWAGIFDEEKRLEIKKEYNRSKMVVNEGPKVGRNDPCPCGSGKKYKKCCGKHVDSEE